MAATSSTATKKEWSRRYWGDEVVYIPPRVGDKRWTTRMNVWANIVPTRVQTRHRSRNWSKPWAPVTRQIRQPPSSTAAEDVIIRIRPSLFKKPIPLLPTTTSIYTSQLTNARRNTTLIKHGPAGAMLQLYFQCRYSWWIIQRALDPCLETGEVGEGPSWTC